MDLTEHEEPEPAIRQHAEHHDTGNPQAVTNHGKRAAELDQRSGITKATARLRLTHATAPA